jgi:hypothetical protein
MDDGDGNGPRPARPMNPVGAWPRSQLQATLEFSCLRGGRAARPFR